MSPKMGQKIKDNPKDVMLRTRVDQATFEKLEFSAKKLKVSKSEIVRRGIESEYIKAQEK